jgi:hypothetical protein
MNRRVATVPIPNGLRAPAALRLPTRRKIAEQNFEVAIQTEFQIEIRRWLVTCTLSYVTLQTALNVSTLRGHLQVLKVSHI